MNVTEVTVSRMIPAGAAEVFDLWIDPKRPGGPWFGANRVIINVAVDGLFYLAVEHGGKRWPHFGRFVEITRPSRMEYTWMSEATQGLESVVVVTFEPQADETKVTLHHSNVPDDAMGRQHEEGWTWVLSMLAEQFAKK